MKKYIAEALGAGTLTLVVALSLVTRVPLSTPDLAGLVLALFVYTIGIISGAHINPAVTIGLWSIQKIKTNEAVLYVIFQFVGASIALFAVSLVAKTPVLTVSGSYMVALAEAVGTFFFTFGIASVIYGKTHESLSGIVIGSSLILGIIIASALGSNGVLNPAVAFGIRSFNIVYLLGPIIGSIAGMNAYKYLHK